MMKDQLSEERKRIYATTRQDLLSRNLSNSERYDNAILTLSTGILTLSLAFIKNVVPLDKSQCLFALKVSWFAFGASIVSTLVSFVLSQIAIKCQLEYAEKYYLDENNEYLNKKNRPALWTEFVNYASGVLFVVGIAATIFFVSLNLKGGNTMAKTTDGAPIPSLQKIATGTLERGATIPGMQPVKPASTTSGQSSGSTSTQSSGSTGKKTK